MGRGSEIINTVWYQNLVSKNLELLEVDSRNPKRIKCRCRTCGHEAWYDNKHDLGKMVIPCNMCKIFDELDKTPKGDYVPVKCEPFIDEHGKLTAKVICKCKKCGYVVRVTLDNYKEGKDKVKCKECGTNKSGVKKIQPKKVASAKKESTNTRVNSTRIQMRNDYRDENNFIDTSDSRVGATAGMLKILGRLDIGIYSDSKKDAKYLCVCNSCHKTADYSSRHLAKSDARCKLCLSASEMEFNDTPEDEIGVYKGLIFNGLKIKKWYRDSDDKYKCIVKCCTCKEETEQDLYLVKSGDVLCKNCMDIGNAYKNAKNPKIVLLCQNPECNGEIVLDYRQFYSNSHARCPECKKELNLIGERGLRDSDMVLRDNLNPYLNKGLKLSKIHGLKQLAVFGEAFKNRDDEMCYNCLCLNHNQEMVLTEKEIDKFNHQYCTGSKAKFMSMFKYAADEVTPNSKKAEKEIVDSTLRK